MTTISFAAEVGSRSVFVCSVASFFSPPSFRGVSYEELQEQFPHCFRLISLIHSDDRIRSFVVDFTIQLQTSAKCSSSCRRYVTALIATSNNGEHFRLTELWAQT